MLQGYQGKGCQIGVEVHVKLVIVEHNFDVRGHCHTILIQYEKLSCYFDLT